MSQYREQTTIMAAFITAVKLSSASAVCLFIFFFASIAMVLGNGTAPKITHIAVGVLDFTVKLTGISTNGAFLPVILFWAFIVFVLVFVVRIIVSIINESTGQ